MSFVHENVEIQWKIGARFRNSEIRLPAGSETIQNTNLGKNSVGILHFSKSLPNGVYLANSLTTTDINASTNEVTQKS